MFALIKQFIAECVCRLVYDDVLYAVCCMHQINYTEHVHKLHPVVYTQYGPLPQSSLKQGMCVLVNMCDCDEIPLRVYNIDMTKTRYATNSQQC